MKAAHSAPKSTMELNKMKEQDSGWGQIQQSVRAFVLPLSASARLPWASELCTDGPVKQQPDSRRTGKRAVAGSET